MIPILMTSQGDEIARGQSSADPLGRDPLRSRPYRRSPLTTIVKRAAGLKLNFYSNVLSQPASRYGMLLFQATRRGIASRNNESNRVVISD